MGRPCDHPSRGVLGSSNGMVGRNDSGGHPHTKDAVCLLGQSGELAAGRMVQTLDLCSELVGRDRFQEAEGRARTHHPQPAARERD